MEKNIIIIRERSEVKDKITYGLTLTFDNPIYMMTFWKMEKKEKKQIGVLPLLFKPLAFQFSKTFNALLHNADLAFVDVLDTEKKEPEKKNDSTSTTKSTVVN